MKKVLATLLFAATALTIGGQAFAEENAADLKRSGKTDVGVSFETDASNKPGDGPFKDNLTLTWMPSSFEFGTQKASGTSNKATYTPKATDQQYLVVNDDRQAEADKKKAFAVTAELSQFVSTKDNTKILDADVILTMEDPKKYTMGEAPITLPNGSVDIDPAYPDANSLAEDATLKGSLEYPELVDTKHVYTISSGAKATPVQLFSKKADADVTGIAHRIEKADLVVYGAETNKAAGHTFTGQITWTLAQSV